MATEEKGPIDLFRRFASGVRKAGQGFKAGVQAEKALQLEKKAADLKKVKRAEAAAKAKATREANKAARIKAAEEAAKPRRGRKPKATTPPAPTPGVKDLKEVKVSAPKPTKGRKAKSTTPADTKTTKSAKSTKSTTKSSNKKSTKEEPSANRIAQAKNEKVMKRVLTGMGLTIGGAGIIGLALGNKKKKYKAVDDPNFQKQLKQYDDSLKKARGYKYGGTTATKAKKRK
jgi:hypothetical protein